MAEHRGTLFFGVPTMYHRLAASGRSSELGPLRLAVSGSAALPAELNREIERASGLAVLERYGMTETLLTVSNPVQGERRPGSIGFPLPGTEVVLGERPDEGPETASGLEQGGAELAVRGPTVFAGYFDKPAQTEERFDGDWFKTGDIGVVEDGYVRLLGRVTEVVISGGHNVYPAEVEDVLLRHPDVAEVAVSGTPSDEWGEVVTAWVVPASGRLDVESLLLHAADGLAPYKRPRIVRQVDSLPRNSMGKVHAPISRLSDRSSVRSRSFASVSPDADRIRNRRADAAHRGDARAPRAGGSPGHRAREGRRVAGGRPGGRRELWRAGRRSSASFAATPEPASRWPPTR